MLYCISLSTSCRLAFQSERRHQGSSLTHPALHYHHQQPCSGAAREEGPAAPSSGRLWSWLHVEQPSPARSLSLAETAGPEAHHEPGILRVQLGGVVAMRPWRKGSMPLGVRKYEQHRLDQPLGSPKGHHTMPS